MTTAARPRRQGRGAHVKGRCPKCNSGWAARASNPRQYATGSSAWRAVRLAVLRDEPLCRTCGELADQVDHIIPVAEGGAELDRANLQPLCDPCHKAKTQQESLRARRRLR
jgi:5-methylcytosine-specific restriction protein A